MTRIKVSHQTLEEAKKLHQSGKLLSAIEIYQALLETESDNPNLYQLTAMAYYQNQEYQHAVTHYKKAIALSPKTSLLYVHLGNVYKTMQQHDLARENYQLALKITPTQCLALHNLGVIAYHQGDIKLAINYYQEAIKYQPGYIDAHYHLAICFLKTGESKKAATLLQETIRLCPRHFSALFMLGIEHMRAENYFSAIETFQSAQQIDTDHLELQINLGHCFFHTKQYPYARDCYRYALQLKPDDKELHFNLGVLAEKENFEDHAINHYLNTLNIDPHYYPAHYNIALVFLIKQHPSKAKKHLEAALSLKSDNQNIKFMLAAIEKDPRLKAAPQEHVKNLFDQYADYYDKHMLEALDYQLPGQILSFYHKLYGINKESKLNILDLGCGTGLAAEKFKPYAKNLTGVDISTNMLAHARLKDFYQHLVLDDVINFLKTHQEQFDLILAADTLIYFGELDTIFEWIATRLSTGGKCLFNLEEGSKSPYIVDQSGRFLHHPSYINQLIEKNNLKLIRATTAISRQQNNQSVSSLLYCMEKSLA